MRIWCCLLCFGDENPRRENTGAMEGGRGAAADEDGRHEAEKLEEGEDGDDAVEDEVRRLPYDDAELRFCLGLPGIKSAADLRNAIGSVGGSKRDVEGIVLEREKSVFEELELSIGGSSSGGSSQLPGLDDNSAVTIAPRRNATFPGMDFGDRFFPDMVPMLPNGNMDWELQFKRAKIECAPRRCHRTTERPCFDDNTALDGVGSFNNMQNSSVFSRNNSPPSSVDNKVSNSSHNDRLNVREDDPDDLDVDGMEIQMDLSDDLLHMVFSFLGHMDLCRAAIVCKQWRAASAHEDFWRSLDFENRNISVAQLEDICNRYPRATEVNLCGNPDMHTLVMKAVSLLRNLESLTLGKGQIGEGFFFALSECPQLRTLVVSDAALGSGVQEITINHDRLQHLQVTKCRVLRVSVRCPQLQTLSLKRSNMAHLGLNCPILHELDIGSCHKLPDTAIRSAVTSCPLLESLDMSNCSCVSDETLRDIASLCPNLQTLNASYCSNISLESVRMPLLTVLKLESCEGITSASMTAIAHSSMLKVLELDNCSLLTSVSLDLPHLSNLRLVHCRKFVDLSLRCLVLSSLTVSNCPALHRISITSIALKKLTLHKQESLNSLSLQCQFLEEVDLSDCESLTNSICDVFSEGGGCPMLKSLVLDNCESLTAVGLCSNSLTSLSLAGCRGITSLNLTCPYLEQVRLDGCDHLEKASFVPVGLQSLNLGICPKLNALHIEAPRMVGLELKGCGVLSEASINCPLLTSLDASFCGQLQDDCLSATTASCPLIDKLILMSCPSIGPDGLLSLRWLRNLTYLDLSYTFLMDLQPVFRSCLGLTVLKLQACNYLNDSSLQPLHKEGALPALCELDLSYGTLCQSAIEELLAYCTHLTHVSLNGCKNMHDLDWGFRANHRSSSLSSDQLVNEPVELPHRLLQNLNCVGCPNIKKVYIPSVACCMHLSSLNLSLSVNLKEVDVACLNLCFLNLSNCSSLEILKLDCPRLTSLFLQSCSIDQEAVESAITRCSILETLDVRFCPKISAQNRLRAVCPSLRRIFTSPPPST